MQVPWIHRGCTMYAPWMHCGCTVGAPRTVLLLELDSSVRQMSPFSPRHEDLHQRLGQAAGPWHRDGLLVPGDVGASWSCACSGEGDEHPGHLVPHPTITQCLELLRWPCSAAVGVSRNGSAGSPVPIQHGERPPTPIPCAGAGDTRRDPCPPPSSLLQHCRCQ